MLSITEALALIDQSVKSLEPVLLPIAEAVGCVVSGDVVAPMDVPRFASSAMDGIAISCADLTGRGPWRLQLQDVIAAGRDQLPELKQGAAAKIMTGASLPPGADTVIPIEQVIFNDNCASFNVQPGQGDFVRPVGDDIKAKDLLLTSGTEITPVDCGVLASIGLTNVEVIPPPTIAVVSTGTEIAVPGEQLKAGQIYDSNSAVLKAFLNQATHKVKTIDRRLPDDREILLENLHSLLHKCDLILTSGGVSMGDFDFLPEIVTQLGGKILFHKVRVKPGKPILCSQFDDCWLLGLPGNPVSVVSSFHLYVKRLIARLMGKTYAPRCARGILQNGLIVRGSRFCLIGARLEKTADDVFVYPATRQKSGRLASIRGINGFIMLSETKRVLKTGDLVDVEWL